MFLMIMPLQVVVSYQQCYFMPTVVQTWVLGVGGQTTVIASLP